MTKTNHKDTMESAAATAMTPQAKDSLPLVSKINLTHTHEEDGEPAPQDYITPRVKIPCQNTDNMQAGTLINSVTLEKLGSIFVPLCMFKYVAMFDGDLNMKWCTLNENDQRVKDAMEGFQWKKGDKPPITKFLNFVVVFEENLYNPLILSYKSATYSLGRQFNTLFAQQCGVNRFAEAAYPQYVNKKRYEITVEKATHGKYTYYKPVVSIGKKFAEIDSITQSRLRGLADNYSMMLKSLFKSQQFATEGDTSSSHAEMNINM